MLPYIIGFHYKVQQSLTYNYIIYKLKLGKRTEVLKQENSCL